MKYYLLICFGFSDVFAKHELYDGHALYEINVRFADEVDVLKSLEYQMNVDFWSYAVPDRPGKVLVARDQKESFENVLNEAGIEFRVEVENIKEGQSCSYQGQQTKINVIFFQKVGVGRPRLLETAARRSNFTGSRLSFDVIHSYEVVDAYLVDLARRYPNTVSVVSAGRSFEGRDIKYLKISTTNFQGNKPIVMLQSLLHAREWVTLPATLYAIQKLVVDVTESDLVEDIDWIILPVANPDGYVWTHTNARFWRKNRRTGLMVADFCMGVDLNRNFDIFWSTASGNHVCLDTFHGTAPFSEPETAGIRDILAEYANRIELYADIHSFGSMILYGYGNGVLPPNALAINLGAVRMAQAIDAVKWAENRNYIVGNIAMVLYDASGGSSDYATAVGVPLSYTFELPAYRNNLLTLEGFLVDPDFIEQAGYETWEGIKIGARFALEAWSRRQK